MSIELVMLSNHLILYRSPSPFAFNLSQHQGLFQWVVFYHHVAKVLELQHQFFQNAVLIFFRIKWFDILAGQGTLKSLLQHYNSKASVLWSSAFLRVQLSHIYVTTGKTIDLTIWTFVGKVLYLPFNMLSRFIISFLSRSKWLSISWLQSLSAVILEPKKIISVSLSTVLPTTCHEMMGPEQWS